MSRQINPKQLVAQIIVILAFSFLLLFASPLPLLLNPVLDPLSASRIRKSVTQAPWKEYSNEKMGITIQIPANWSAREVVEPNPLQDYRIMIDTDKYGSALSISQPHRKRDIQHDSTKNTVEIDDKTFLTSGRSYTYLGAENTIEFYPIPFIGYRDGHQKSQQELYNIADQIIKTIQINP